MAPPGVPRRTLAYAPEYEQEVLESEVILADDAPETLLSALTMTNDGGTTMSLDGDAPAAVDVYNSGTPHDRSGEVIHDRYQLLRMLGKGGMGTVYLARHTGLPKTFAVKLLNPRYGSRPDVASRFLQEAQAVSLIEHPNVVGVTDFGTMPDGGAFLVMEHLRGESLAALCKREAPLAWPRARHILAQICRALAAAHAVGVIHRDIKPENVLRTTSGTDPDFVKVLDFGLAKLQSGGGLRLTRTGMVLGTPEYMSPEQACGLPTDQRTDIYATGALLYELLCGRPPFRAKNFVGMRHHHMMVRPQPPSEHAPGIGITPEMDAICLRALAKLPDHRFESMTAMLAAIEAVGTGVGPVPLLEGDDPDGIPTVELRAGRLPGPRQPRSGARPITPAPEPRRSLGWPLGIAAVLIVGVGVGIGVTWMAMGGKDEPAVELAADAAAPAQAPDPDVAPTAPVAATPASHVELRFATNTPVRILDARDSSLFARGEVIDRIELPRAEAPVRLILRAPGYQDLELEVTPDQDRALEVTLEPAPDVPVPGPVPIPGRPRKTGGSGKSQPTPTPGGPDKTPEPVAEPSPEPKDPPPEPPPSEPEPELPPIDPELVDPWAPRE